MSYASESDLTTLGVPSAALSGISSATIQAALDRASGVIDSYLATRNTLPVVGVSDPSYVDPVLIQVCVDLARRYLISGRGFAPGAGQNQEIVDAYLGAIEWLKDYARSRVDLVGMTDSTPDLEESAPYVSSNDPAGWV